MQHDLSQTNSLDYLNDNAIVRIKRTGDQVFTIALISYYLFGLLIAFEYNTFFIAFGVGTLSLIAYYGSKILLPDQTLYQYVGSAIVAVFTAQFIYQMHGLAEMHFFVFIGATLLIAYQNWLLQLPNIILVVAHHGAFAYWQYQGNKEIYFTQQDYMDLQTFVIHGALAAVVVLISGYWSYILEKRTTKETQIKSEMTRHMTNIKNNIAFAEFISQGKLDVDYSLADEKDELGTSLLKMQKSLVIAQKKDNQDRFVTVGIAQMSEILRSGADIQTLSYQIISNLVKYLNANQGGIFIIQDKETDPHLQLTACYAYDRRKYQQKRVDIGEGLVGQCYLEGDTMFLTDLPQSYMQITSGLGKANPNCVLIVPLKFNDTIEGVIELASFSVFEEHQVRFVNMLAEMTASAVSTTRTNEVTKKLLDELKQQTEMLRSQEEEMRQNMEELAATQEEMERRQAEMEETRQQEIRRFQQHIAQLESQLKTES